MFKAGAVIVYTPEVGIDLDILRKDVEFLKTRYKIDVKGEADGRLVLRSVSSDPFLFQQLTFNL